MIMDIDAYYDQVSPYIYIAPKYCDGEKRTLIVDCYDMLMGFSRNFDVDEWQSSLECIPLTNAMTRKQWRALFRAQRLKLRAARYQASTVTLFAIPGNAKGKGQIERGFRTMEEKFGKRWDTLS